MDLSFAKLTKNYHGCKKKGFFMGVFGDVWSGKNRT